MNTSTRSKEQPNERQTTSFLRELPLFRHVKKKDLGVFAEQVETRKFRKGGVIYREGIKADAAFIVQTGVAKLATYSTGGQVMTLELAVAGDIFGALCPNNVRRYHTSAFASTDCALLRVPVAELHRLDLQYKSVQDGLFAKVCADLKHSQTWRGLALENADRRIAHALLYFAPSTWWVHPADPGLDCGTCGNHS